jgi:hypothetical protein
MARHPRTPPTEETLESVRARRISRRDITATWQLLVLLAIVRLALAFHHGERPFDGSSLTEAGFAFVLLMLALPKALRDLARALLGTREARENP